MRVRLVLYLGGLCLACQGCAPLGHAARTSIVQPIIYPRWVNEWIDCCRDRKLAQSAWLEFASSAPTACSVDFEKGFKEGFADYLFWGGTGAPPPVPPRCYWNAKFETPQGHQAIEDWFAGFRKGAEKARASGYRKLAVVPASTCLPSMLPETSGAPSLPASAGQGSSVGTGAGLEEALPPPRPVPGPENRVPAPQPQTGPRLPEAPSGRPGGIPPVSDETSTAPSRSIEDLLAPQAPSRSVEELLAPQALSEPSARGGGAGSDPLLKILKNSWDPWQRMSAAEQLGQQDLSTQPSLRLALATAAQEDRAAGVQAVCRRLLAEAEMPGPVETLIHKSSAPQDSRKVNAEKPARGWISED